MRFQTFTAASLLAGILPLASYAQTTPRFYVGAGANLLTNVPFTGGNGPQLSASATPRLYGPSLTAGLQLNSRLALQTGVSYFWKNSSYYSSFYQNSPDPSQPFLVIQQGDFQAKYFTIPVLLRYTFAPAAERFHVDALAGVTLALNSYHNSYSDNSYPYYFDYDGSTTKASVTLGPAVRYTLVPNVELTANALVSATLGVPSYYHFSDRLFLNVLVGAQYSFGH
jgi:hypothetical protein